jgi:acetolactate synthase-1/2/3 large subunit
MKFPDYLAGVLKSHGVRFWFGIPGGPSIPYLEAFRDKGIQFILTSHEASAAVMADVTARLTGITGVCHATFGPGATNLSTGVGGALLDRSPLLALTSEMPDEWKDRTAQMNIDHQALFRPLTKATFRLTPGDAGEVIDHSLALAREEYPGPVHLGLPTDLAGGEVMPGRPGKNTGSGPLAERMSERVRLLLASSRRPLIAAGLTAVRIGAGDMLHDFLEQCHVPVVLTPMAKGIIPADHRSYAGVLFHALSDRLNRLVGEADLVIGLGYDPVEYNYESWLHDVPLVHFDTRETDTAIRGTLQVTAPPEKWFEYLRELKSSPGMMSLAAEARNAVRHELQASSRGFTPVTVLEVLRDMLPPDAIVTADVGSHLHLMGQMWDCGAPGKLIMTNGWSSMGFGLPAAIGAALAEPNATVVCVTGDGGLMMHAGEMLTARRYGLKIITVVLADGELNLIRLKESWKNVSPYGTGLYRGPLFGSRKYLGTDVISVSGRAQMRNAVSRSLLADKSVIIEAVIDPAVYSDLIVRS